MCKSNIIKIVPKILFCKKNYSSCRGTRETHMKVEHGSRVLRGEMSRGSQCSDKKAVCYGLLGAASPPAVEGSGDVLSLGNSHV